jgi:ABC-2 type transport system ATP-binding protein
MAERVVVIDHGRIIADDTAEALKAEQAGDRISLTVGTADASTVRAVVDQIGSQHTETRTDDGLRIDFRVDRATRTLPRLVHTLGDKGVDVLEASAHQPTLDDVFLNLTGRSLREAVETGAEA